MEINLTEIYKGLDEWRAERGITAESQKAGYLVNVMEEFGELSQALRDYEKIKKGEQVKKKIVSDWYIADNNIYLNSPAQYITLADAARELIKYKEVTLADAEHEIIDALCDIAVFTINAGADSNYKPQTLDTYEKDEIITRDVNYRLKNLLTDCGAFNIHSCYCGGDLLDILTDCAKLCEHYGYNFEIAMLETIKEISSRTGSYDEKAKKWVKDHSDEAKAKWYKANYELARIKQ